MTQKGAKSIDTRVNKLHKAMMKDKIFARLFELICSKQVKPTVEGIEERKEGVDHVVPKIQDFYEVQIRNEEFQDKSEELAVMEKVRNLAWIQYENEQGYSAGEKNPDQEGDELVAQGRKLVMDKLGGKEEYKKFKLKFPEHLARAEQEDRLKAEQEAKKEYVSKLKQSTLEQKSNQERVKGRIGDLQERIDAVIGLIKMKRDGNFTEADQDTFFEKSCKITLGDQMEKERIAKLLEAEEKAKAHALA